MASKNITMLERKMKEIKEEISKATWHIEQAEKELKEMGFSFFQDAEKALGKMEKDIAQMKESLETMLEDLAEEVDALAEKV